MTTPVLSDHVVSRPAPAAERLEFSGSPFSPVHPMLASTSMILVLTNLAAVGSVTMSKVEVGEVSESAPRGTV